jgi:4-hydroxy-4-methyl-2-oxoglutarate aldolase
MIRRYGLSLLLAASSLAPAQVFTLTREQLMKYTEKSPYDRFPDGRPKVPDAVMKRFKDLSAEEVWTVLNQNRYLNQWAGDFQITHPEKKLIGRAFTVQFMPRRPDIAEVNEADAKAKGFRDNGNQRALDMLQPGDVLVADLLGKIEGGTIVGDNLATYIHEITGNGFVVNGAIRDLDGIFPIDMSVYYKGVHPTPISRELMITGINVPIHIGEATVMPGDLVFGDREGVYFVPTQFLKQILDNADILHIHDEWTQEKFTHNNGKYKSSDIYGSPRSEELKKEYQEYLKKRLPEVRAKEGQQ